MKTPLAGFPAYIFRAHGIPRSAESKNLFYGVDIILIVRDGLPPGEGLNKFLIPDPDLRPVVIKNRSDLRFIYAEPLQAGKYEYGGTFIFSDHPDFYKLSPYPIPLHDRPKH